MVLGVRLVLAEETLVSPDEGTHVVFAYPHHVSDGHSTVTFSLETPYDFQISVLPLRILYRFTVTSTQIAEIHGVLS